MGALRAHGLFLACTIACLHVFGSRVASMKPSPKNTLPVNRRYFAENTHNQSLHDARPTNLSLPAAIHRPVLEAPLSIEYYNYGSRVAPEDMLYLLIQTIEECHSEIVDANIDNLNPQDATLDPNVDGTDMMWEEDGIVLWIETPLRDFKWSWAMRICMELTDFWKARRYTSMWFVLYGNDGVQVGSGHLALMPARQTVGATITEVGVE